MSRAIVLSSHEEISSTASSDDQLIEIWVHGRSGHTERAYRADVQRFRARAGKALTAVTLPDVHSFTASSASR